MNNKLFLFIILFCAIATKMGFAQDMIIYDELKKSEIVFKYSPYEKDNSLPNYFISSMAHSQARMRSYYKYKITSSIHSKITKHKSNNYTINIEIDSLKTVGNFDYKGFNFSRIIIPKTIELSYQLVEINKNDVKSFSYGVEPEIRTHYSIENNYYDSTKQGAFKLQNEKLIYRFGSNQKEEFDSAVALIDSYYNDGQKLEKIKNDLSSLNPDNIDNIKLQNIDLKYITKRFKKINTALYASKLSLDIDDPAGYYGLYNLIESQINILQSRFSKNIQSLDSLFYSKAMEFISDSNFISALTFLNKSLEINPKYTPSLFQIALIDYKNDKFIASKQNLNKILEIITDNAKYNDLANKVYQKMLLEGVKLNNEENYIDGLRVLLEAEKFCDKNSTIVICNPKQNTLIDSAKIGIYNSYLSIAGAAMQRGRLDMTEDYLNIAKQYQQNNESSIKDVEKLNALYTLLVTDYLSQSIELKKNYEYNKSKRKWLYADSLCRALDLKDASTFVAEVDKQLGDANSAQTFATSKSAVTNYKIDIPKDKIVISSPQKSASVNYKDHYDKGDIYYRYRRYPQAYTELKLAKEIREQFDISAVDSLDSYFTKSSKAVILKNLKTANLYVWGKKYKAAEMMLSKAEQQIVSDRLSNDNEIRLAISNLKNELKSQKDSKISKQFENKMLKARQSANLKDFISLEKYCNEAIELSQNNKAIPLDTNYPYNLKKKYASTIAYQKAKSNADAYRNSRQFKEAIEALNIANQLFDNDSLQKYSLHKQSLYSFVNESPSKALIEAAIESSLKQGDVLLALDLWKEAIGYKYLINSTLAARIMSETAKLDKLNKPNINKKELYNQRFGKNPNFSKYRKHYLKEF
jgi:hypothetical protein